MRSFFRSISNVAFTLRLRAIEHWRRNGQLSDAKKAIDRIIDDYPNQSAAHVCRGAILDQLGDTVSAIRDYTIAINLDPNNVAVLTARAAAYRATGQNQEALGDLTLASSLGCDDAALYYERGCVWSQLQEYDKAIADCTEAIRRDQTCIYAVIMRATLLVEKDQIGEAIKELKSVFNLSVEISSTYGQREVFWQADGDPESTIRDCSQQLSRHEGEPAILISRASAYLSLERREEAAADCREAGQALVDLLSKS